MIGSVKSEKGGNYLEIELKEILPPYSLPLNIQTASQCSRSGVNVKLLHVGNWVTPVLSLWKRVIAIVNELTHTYKFSFFVNTQKSPWYKLIKEVSTERYTSCTAF